MAAQVYTRGFKRRVRLTAAVITMAAGIAPFVVTLALLQSWASPPPYAMALLTAATFVAAGLAPWYSHGTLALLGNHGLRQRVAGLAEGYLDLDTGPDAQTGASPDDGVPAGRLRALGATFVGFSPGDKLRVWDGETDRDVGFLCIRDAALVYVGDEFRWSLPLERIDQIELAPAVTGVRRIIVRWHAPRGGPRAFSVVSREANTLEGMAIVTRRLYEALREWIWSDEEDEIPARSHVPWGYPPTDTAGGWALDQPVSGCLLTVTGMAVIVVLTIWRVSWALIQSGDYYAAILWAGLIAVVGAVFTGYLLSYLHAWDSQRQPRARQ